MNEIKYIEKLKTAAMMLAGALVLLVFAGWVFQNRTASFRTIQRAALKAESPHIQRVAILEQNLEGLHRTDRCITCHFDMLEEHPGSYLVDHPMEDFGCTVCHEGQGRATNTMDAHGTDPRSHWERPLRQQPYIQSSCGRCHTTIFSPSDLASADNLEHGKEIFMGEGCLGCHSARGTGGFVGPDLTRLGEKNPREYDFSNISSEKTIENWLIQHFKDPELVSPGSEMLKVDLSDPELADLSTFVLSLEQPDFDLDYLELETIQEFKGMRGELSGSSAFLAICSGCHGASGEGKDFEAFSFGVPAIKNPDFTRLVSDDFIGFTLKTGRTARKMASWDPQYSGMKQNEIDSLVLHLLGSRYQTNLAFDRTGLINANMDKGAGLFAENCATCHGERGEGGIGLAVLSKDYLKVADNAMIFSVLQIGRGNTAMPSWENLSLEERYAIVKFMRAYGRHHGTTPIILSEGDPEQGERDFRFACSRCHGANGEGDTGPSIINRDFMRTASDDFLFRTIAYGRAHTAMFGWQKEVYNNERLTDQAIGDVIAYMRKMSRHRPTYIYTATSRGDRTRGVALFADHCSACHGDQGEGVKAPALNNQEFLNAATNGFLLGTLTIGRPGTAMPPWGYETSGFAGLDTTAEKGRSDVLEVAEFRKLSMAEREDITAFLRSWQRVNISYE